MTEPARPKVFVSRSLPEPGIGPLLDAGLDITYRQVDSAPARDELLAGVGEARIYVGHTHLPFQRVGAAGVEIVNPGSVGMPFDGNPRAAYALLDDDGTVQQRRVHYDHASAARRVREQARGAAWGETVGKRIERAQFLVR